MRNGFHIPNSQSGFSLISTLIAAGIILAVVGAITAVMANTKMNLAATAKVGEQADIEDIVLNNLNCSGTISKSLATCTGTTPVAADLYQKNCAKVPGNDSLIGGKYKIRSNCTEVVRNKRYKYDVEYALDIPSDRRLETWKPLTSNAIECITDKPSDFPINNGQEAHNVMILARSRGLVPAVLANRDYPGCRSNRGDPRYCLGYYTQDARTVKEICRLGFINRDAECSGEVTYTGGPSGRSRFSSPGNNSCGTFDGSRFVLGNASPCQGRMWFQGQVVCKCGNGISLDVDCR